MKPYPYFFKSVVSFIILATLFINHRSAFSQSLEGKWNIAKLDTRHSTILQFTQDSLIYYDFDNRHSATSYHVDKNRIAVDTGSIPIGGTYEFIHSQRLRLHPERAKQPIDFVRLKPTTTTLTQSEIEQLNFNLKYHDHNLAVNFNPAENDSSIPVRLERIDSTYFISFYQNEKRKGAMPIDQVTTKGITVYGFPEKPFVVSGKRVMSGEHLATSNGSFNEEHRVSEAILGKWFYERIKGRPSLSECTKKTFFHFSEHATLLTQPYAKNYSNGNCIEGQSISGTYAIINADQIRTTQEGATEIWNIQALSKTTLVVEKDGETLTLTKKNSN